MALGRFCTDQLRPRPNIFQHRPEARLLISFIIWQGSTGVNLNVLIAWFLLGPYLSLATGVSTKPVINRVFSFTTASTCKINNFGPSAT